MFLINMGDSIGACSVCCRHPCSLLYILGHDICEGDIGSYAPKYPVGSPESVDHMSMGNLHHCELSGVPQHKLVGEY